MCLLSSAAAQLAQCIEPGIRKQAVHAIEPFLSRQRGDAVLRSADLRLFPSPAHKSSDPVLRCATNHY
jgi:hypothetical protein